MSAERYGRYYWGVRHPDKTVTHITADVFRLDHGVLVFGYERARDFLVFFRAGAPVAIEHHRRKP